MDFVPPDMSGSARARIWAALKQLDHQCKMHSIGMTECVRHAWIAYATEWARTKPLTAEERSQTIPLWVARAARGLRWLTTRRMIRPGVRWYFSVVPPPPPEKMAAFEDIPEVVHQAYVTRLVEDLIADWRPGALAPEVNPEGEITQPAEQESPQALLVRMLTRYKLNDIAFKVGVVRSTLYRWKRDAGSVKSATDRKIVLGLRKLAAKTPSE
jgi:hypothetical protein